jgi:hypothetical protein
VGDSSYCNSVCSTAMSVPNKIISAVAGAFTQKASLEIRGPAVNVSPRGAQ